ncbi:MAG: hypothetical protein WCH32_15835, partial [Pseudomonadota bacterium]
PPFAATGPLALASVRSAGRGGGSGTQFCCRIFKIRPVHGQGFAGISRSGDIRLNPLLAKQAIQSLSESAA